MKTNIKRTSLVSLFLAFLIALVGFAFSQTSIALVNAEETLGSKENPYTISTLAELESFRDDVNNGNTYAGKYIKLTADIDLGNKSWTPIGTSTNTFSGMFDGDNHTIKNLKIDWSTEWVSGGPNDNYAGLFGYMKGGNTAGIKNVIVENADVTACLYVGVILGRSYTGGIIENCHVKGEIKVDAYSYAGIIVGRHEYSSGLNANGDKMSIYNCSVEGVGKTATVNCEYAVSYAGGIVGFLAENYFVFENLSVKNVEIMGTYGLGGISGIGHYGNVFKNVSVENINVISVNNDPESNRTTNVGLIVGACQGTESENTVFKNYKIEQSITEVNGEEVERVFGDSMSGSAPITNFVAKVGNLKYYETVEEATKNATFEDEITLIKDTDEDFEIPAGVKLNTNGFDAPSVTVEPLEIEDITVERNAEDNATIVTITYLNSQKVTTIVIPDGKDGVNGSNGADGKDGVDGTNGIDGVNGLDGKDGLNGVNGKDANSSSATVSIILSSVSLVSVIALCIIAFIKKR